MRRALLFVLPVAAIFFACTSDDDDEGDASVLINPCCPPYYPMCGIEKDDAGACLACCRGSTCGFPPESDGACATSEVPDAAPQCATNADCGPGFFCAYPLADGCQSVAQCVAMDAASCDQTIPFCGCGGTTVSCVVEGFASAPVSTVGACKVDAGIDSSSDSASDAPSDSSSADASGE